MPVSKEEQQAVLGPQRSLHRKLAQIMYEAERIPKRGKAPKEMGGYPFVQVGDAADFIRKALAEKVITMMPTNVTVVGMQDRPTKSGGNMTTVDLLTEWTLTDGESGESITIVSFGAGADGGDKYSGKASTSTMKYALLTAFLLSTGEDSELGRDEPIHVPAPERTDDGGLIGVVEAGTSKDSDLELRETPDGWAIGFRLKANGRGGIKVVARDALAQGIAAWKANLVGQRVTCWGRISDETFTPKGTQKKVTYQVLALERIQTPDMVLPAPLEVNVPSGDNEAERIGEQVAFIEAVAPGQEALPLDKLDPEERLLVTGGLPE